MSQSTISAIDSTPIPLVSHDPDNTTGPFEGPEKLLEVWFRPNVEALPQIDHPSGKLGLRAVDRAVWEEMLDIVKCKVLNAIEGVEVDAYLLSESSFFVFPHKLILKTCGTTLNLLGLPRILDIAKRHCGFTEVYRFFYSRKSFMFPERQQGPHKEWRAEVEYLDNVFAPQRGAAYTVGKVNGDHWLLYLNNPVDGSDSANNSEVEGEGKAQEYCIAKTTPPDQDYTLEILMTKLSAEARSAFFFPDVDSVADAQAKADQVSKKLAIDSLFPQKMTTLDSYAFGPCGYSANALIRPTNEPEGYFTIHVTPEDGWSFASFECNVPVSHYDDAHKAFPDLRALIQRVVQIFQPGHLSLTLFVTSHDSSRVDGCHVEAPVDSAHRAFHQALKPKGYKRTDKINYEFGGYDLAFASFELCI